MSRLLRLFILFVFLTIGSASALAQGHRLFVSPEGNDAWSGRLDTPNAEKTDGPLATPAKALELVRQMRKAEPNPGEPIEIVLRGGVYRIAEPILFTPDDSGTAQSPTIVRAFENEEPIISGAVRLTGWTVDQQGRWHTTLPTVEGRDWRITQLFVDNQRCYRPRLPRDGYWRVEGILDPTEENKGRGFDRFTFPEGTIRPDWHNLEDVELLTIHSWTMSRLPIRSVDLENRAVTFFGHTPSASWWSQFVPTHPFLVENVREALQDPGQWYFDSKTREVIYIPREGQTPENTVVEAPLAEALLVFKGQPGENRFVEHLQFEGVTLAHTNWATPKTGQAFPQAEVNIQAAVSAVAARNVALRDCIIRNVGGYGIAFTRWCKDNTVERCELFDLGAGGIRIGGGGGPGSWETVQGDSGGPESLSSGHVVRDCLIAHGGRLHSAGIGVWIGHASDNRIEHNEIADFYYSSVSVGWIWGYGPSRANHNIIRANHMHTIGQGVLSDMGGVYTLGISPGTVIELNRIHDVDAYDYGGWGLYTDEGSTDIVMRNNVVYRTKTGSFHQHYGKENRIENNIMVDSRMHQIQRTRVEEHRSFVFERNIVYWKTGPLLAGNWGGNQYLFDRNTYWHVGDEPGEPTFDFAGMSLAQWREKGQDLHSVIADPRFVDPEHDDYRLRDDSPALKAGFEPFDQSLAGRLTTPNRTDKLPPVPRAFPKPEQP